MPRRDIDRLQAEIDELFSEVWRGPRYAGPRQGFRPSVDSFHTAEPHALTVVVELPGIDPASIRLVVGERTLVVAGERRRPKVEGCVYQQMEIAYGPFSRRIQLPEDVDPAGAEARYEHGVVTITLPVTDRGPARGRHAIAVVLG